MLNKIELIGRVGSVKNNENCLFFSVATDSGFGDKKKTMWHNIVVYKQLQDICSKYISVGMLVYVSGELTTYVNKDGNTVYQVFGKEVKFLTRKQEEGSPVKEDYSSAKTKSVDSDFEDIPF